MASKNNLSKTVGDALTNLVSNLNDNEIKAEVPIFSYLPLNLFRFQGKFEYDKSLGMDFVNRVVPAMMRILDIELKMALDTAISSPVWGDGNDIVDTGALRDSLDISYNGLSLQISYGVPYAGLIHYGGYILPYGNSRASMVYIAARPWIDSVIFGSGPVPKYDFDSAYYRAVDEVFG